MPKLVNIFQPIIDFFSEKSSQLVDYVLDFFGTFSDIIQAIILFVIGILVLIGVVAVIKKSAKLIVVLAAILVIVSVIWMFI